jgi:capsular polysaccharide transport system permease protein
MVLSQSISSAVSSRSRWLREGLREQTTVVWALMMREVMTRFGRYKLGYLWAFLEPVVHISVWFVIRILIRDRGGTADMSAWLFLGSGIMPFLMFMGMSGYVGGAFSANRGLLAFPPVKPMDTIISRFLLEATILIVVAVALFSGMVMFGVALWPDSLLTLIAAGGGMMLLGVGFGLCKAIGSAFFPVVNHFNLILTRTLYLTSGLMYDPEKLPPDLQYWISFNPCLHGIQLFRHGYSHLYVTTLADPWYLYAWALGLLTLGLLLERLTRHRMKDLP